VLASAALLHTLYIFKRLYNHGARCEHAFVVVSIRVHRTCDNSVKCHYGSCPHAAGLLHLPRDQCHHHSHGCSSPEAM
jgi:hypothetical protein